MKIYWTSIEFKFLKESPNFENYKGGLVYAFVKASDAKNALMKFEDSLKENKLRSSDIEFVKPYDEELEWEDDEQTAHFINLYQEAVKNNDVVLDDWYFYEND